MLGYTTPQRVMRRTGSEFDSHQIEECLDLIGAAEAFIDHRTGRSWLRTSAPVTETHTAYSQEIRLRGAPVVSVTGVTYRRLRPAYESVVVAPGDWELLDATRGIVLVPGLTTRRGVVVQVTYVPTAISAAQVDPRVRLAATDLVAFWMGPALGGAAVPSDIQSYSVGGDLSVTFRQGTRILGVPDDIVATLELLRPARMAFA